MTHDSSPVVDTTPQLEAKEETEEVLLAERLETKIDYNLNRVHTEMKAEIERLNKKIWNAR